MCNMMPLTHPPVAYVITGLTAEPQQLLIAAGSMDIG